MLRSQVPTLCTARVAANAVNARATDSRTLTQGITELLEWMEREELAGATHVTIRDVRHQLVGGMATP
jgi:hypothetical protein